MTSTNSPLPAHYQVAQYKEQLQPRFKGNKLVEAFPKQLTISELRESLELKPDFSEEARTWDSGIRIGELYNLKNFMTPLSNHLMTARVLDSMLREGCLGRNPRSPEHMRIFHKIHAHGAQAPSKQTANTLTPQHSTGLLGFPGMGKTTLVLRYLALFARVYYHPDLDFEQVTYIFISTPSDGKGTKGLAISIIQQLDELLPHRNYYQQYVETGRKSAPVLIHIAARLMNRHCVGVLVVDELQNIGNAKKDDRILMSELTTLANLTEAPQFYIGTSKARPLLNVALHHTRRGVDMGLGNWDALPEFEYVEQDGQRTREYGEWAAFIEEMWQYQWVKTPVPLSAGILSTLYDCTQGILDIAIKLFIVSQATAIYNGSETLSEQHIRQCYDTSMTLLHRMMDALRSKNPDRIAQYEDMRMPSIEDFLNGVKERYSLKRIPSLSLRSGTPAFQEALTKTAVSLGLPPEEAAAAAEKVNEQGTAANVLEGAQQLLDGLKPAKQPSNKKRATGSKPAAERPFPQYRPEDYRNATAHAARDGTPVAEQFRRLRLVKPIEELICLD